MKATLANLVASLPSLRGSVHRCVAFLLFLGGLAVVGFMGVTQFSPHLLHRTHIRLATSSNLWCALSLLADELRYYEDEGLNVQLSYRAAGRLNMAALVADSADIGNIVEVNLANYALSGGNDLSIVASIVAARDFSIVAKRSSNIRSRAALKGKMIGFANGTGAEMYVRSLATQQGWSAHDLRLRTIDPDGLQTAIDSQVIDAAAVWEPFAYSIARHLGTDAFVIADPAVYEGVMNVAVRSEWAREHPAAIPSFLKALVRAESFVNSHPDSARRILAQRVGLDSSTVAAVWEHFAIRVNLDTVSQNRLTRHVAAVLSAGDTKRELSTQLDFGPYFDTRFLTLAKRMP